MKTLLLSLCFLPALASANAIELPGIFLSPSQTFDMSPNEEACKENGGKWSGDVPDEGICVYSVDDTVTVSHTDGAYYIDITTWGSNGHTCNYEGKAELVGNTLVSESRSEFADEGEDATCKIVVSYLDANSVSVSEAEGSRGCRYWCGARAFGFGIEKATRK